MRTEYYRCHSIVCDGDDVLIKYNNVFDINHIKKRKCKRCKDIECIIKVPDDYEGFKDPFKYQYFDKCHSCDNWSLLSSGTGSCHRCDNPSEYRERDERGRFVSTAKWDVGSAPMFIEGGDTDSFFREYEQMPVSGTRADASDWGASGSFTTEDAWSRSVNINRNRCTNCNAPIAGLALGGLCGVCGTDTREFEIRRVIRLRELRTENARRQERSFWERHDRDLEEARVADRERRQERDRERERREDNRPTIRFILEDD